MAFAHYADLKDLETAIGKETSLSFLTTGTAGRLSQLQTGVDTLGEVAM